MSDYYIGIDIGGTKCAVVRGNANGQILHKERFPTELGVSPQVMLERIAQAVTACGVEGAKGIGISCGGPLDSNTGVILSPPNLPGWDHVEICDFLTKRFRLPVRLLNDANACTIAEWRFGAGKGCSNVVFLTFGTGMGAGLILNNRLYEGRNGFAGEIGHVRMERFGPVGFGKPGSFEGFCSGSGIAQLAQSYALAELQQGRDTAFCATMDELSGITAASVAQAAEGGDETALSVYETAGRYLGRGLSILMDVLNPDVIVLGSIYGRSRTLLQAAMEEHIRKETISASVCPVVPAALGEAIGDMGALCVGMGVC